jgi:hypothetical protein
MSQGEIVGPAASGKLIPSIQPHNRPGTTLNSFGRCLKIIDTFRRGCGFGRSTRLLKNCSAMSF